MGYSCSTKAADTLDALLENTLIKAGPVVRAGGSTSSNEWKVGNKTYFFERGREQDDGAITGTVMLCLPVNPDGKTYCRRAGSVRINPDGTISRFPTATPAQKRDATAAGLARYNERFTRTGGLMVGTNR